MKKELLRNEINQTTMSTITNTEDESLRAAVDKILTLPVPFSVYVRANPTAKSHRRDIGKYLSDRLVDLFTEREEVAVTMVLNRIEKANRKSMENVASGAYQVSLIVNKEIQAIRKELKPNKPL